MDKDLETENKILKDSLESCKKDIEYYKNELEFLKKNDKQRDQQIERLNDIIKSFNKKEKQLTKNNNITISNMKKVYDDKLERKRLEGYAEAKLEDEKFKRMLYLKAKKYKLLKDNCKTSYRVVGGTIEFIYNDKIIHIIK